jgi:hypothetical protein
MALLASRPGFARKVLRIEQTPDGIVVKNVADDEAVNVTRGSGVHRTILRVARPEGSGFSSPLPRLFAKDSDLTSRIKGGRTVEGGSRWASHMVAGHTARQSSPFASAIPGGRYSGFPASTSARGIANFGMRSARPLWASRLR